MNTDDLTELRYLLERNPSAEDFIRMTKIFVKMKSPKTTVSWEFYQTEFAREIAHLVELLDAGHCLEYFKTTHDHLKQLRSSKLSSL